MMQQLKLASFTIDNQPHWGGVTADGVIPARAYYQQYPTLLDFIRADINWNELTIMGRAYSDFTYNIPLHAPQKIICVGVNFPDRNAEYKDGSDAPQYMSLFPRFARSFTAHNCPLIRPPESPQLDYEGEMVVIIGKEGRRIQATDAHQHIAALTIANEGTIRDWVRHAKFNVTQGKNWDNSGALGPWIVPFTDKTQIENAEIETRVNGELRQKDNSARMMFPIAEQIAYISTFTTLQKGDMIITGTPTGAGARFDPPIFLQPGDTIEVSISNIGTLVNTVADEIC